MNIRDDVLRWGFRPTGRRRTLEMAPARMQRSLPNEGVDMATAILPSDFQREGSCTFRMACGLYEVGLRLRARQNSYPRPFEDGEQMDAEKLYWMWMEETHGDHVDRGAQLRDPLDYFVKLGLFRPETHIVEVPPNLHDIAAALQKGPLAYGFAVDEGWEQANVNTENGGLAFRAVNPFTIYGYHAVLGTQYIPASDKHEPLLGFANSWGTDWGWKGQGLMSWATWGEYWRWQGDGPYAVHNLLDQLPEGDKYRQYVVKVGT